MPLALLRAVPRTFDRALSARAPEPPIDVARARAQHIAYAEGLAWLGFDVEMLSADERHPDCPFIEDTAVLAEGVALVTRPGAPSRQGEVEAVAAALAGRARMERMEAPATLDGGDVLHLGGRLFVGRTPRSNAAGIARLTEAFAPAGLEVVPVPVSGLLHLKCACSPLGDARVLVAEGALPPATFAPAEVVPVPAGEAYAANAVELGGRVLLSAGHPGARAALEALGYQVREVDTGEFRKADGALTCLSLRFS